MEEEEVKEPETLPPALPPRQPKSDTSTKPQLPQKSKPVSEKILPISRWQDQLVKPVILTSASTYVLSLQGAAYVKLRLPETIGEWMSSLGLPQYTAPFIKNGWDQINFLAQISDQDLVNMGISDSQHRKRILQSLNEMKTT